MSKKSIMITGVSTGIGLGTLISVPSPIPVETPVIIIDFLLITLLRRFELF